MSLPYKSFVFSGGGVLGISYLGLLEYLDQINLTPQLERVAGASAGAITACVTCFNTSFEELKSIINTLDYTQIPDKNGDLSDMDEPSRLFPKAVKEHLDNIFGNIDCVYRMVKRFGWYSSNYFYGWIRKVIAAQFDPLLKKPPYTFADFANPAIHKEGRIFKELYIVGTDVSKSISTVFSLEATPHMEVAEAVRISMSVPLFFEAVHTNCDICPRIDSPLYYVDGGLLYNYPINLFDEMYPPCETLGAYFKSTPKPRNINNLVEFIAATIHCATTTQYKLYQDNKANLHRSIPIFTGDISALEFNVKTNDHTYRFLYEQGYRGTEAFFSLYKNPCKMKSN